MSRLRSRSIALVASALAGCGPVSDHNGLPHPDPGSTTITVLPGPTIPGTTVGTIDITVEGPGATRYLRLAPGEGPLLVDELAVGTWTVHASAVQSFCESACEGRAELEIWSGENVELEVAMPCDLQCKTPVVCHRAVGVPFESVSVGYRHSCAIGEDGALCCWGEDGEEENLPDGRVSDTPAGVFLDVGASDGNSCAIAASGTVECWGDPTTLLAREVPDGTYSRLAMGSHHACVVDGRGTMVCWGEQDVGLLDKRFPSTPRTDVEQVDAGARGTCVVDTDGQMVCWGPLETGVPSGAFASVSVGYKHACAVDLQGSVTCFGEPFSGELTPPEGTFDEVAATMGHACALREEGVVCWPEDPILMGPFNDLLREPLSGISGDSGGYCALDVQGEIVCWGRLIRPVLNL